MGFHSQTRSRSPAVLIFDWDDTICPSSFVDKFKVDSFGELPTYVQETFDQLAKCAERCLREASKYGEVLIITNSDEGWVKFSCERYIPQLLPLVEQYKIVSARTGYERFYPGQPLCWKAAAFAHEVNEIFERTLDAYELNQNNRSLESTDVSSASEDSFQSAPIERREVISFGDSMEERTAVRIVAQQFSARPKSVMFVQSPTPTQIIGQLEILTNYMKFLCTQTNDLDLEISRMQADKSADSFLRRTRRKSNGSLADDLDRMIIRPAASAGSDAPIATISG